MSIILNIDTSIETASVSIAKEGVIQTAVINEIQKEHASFLHNAIKQLLEGLSLDINKIDAIAVANGPGSYTGLRVGLASAKGFCYALNKPLITIGTLNYLATAAIDQEKNKSALFCPMIDARRAEVYTAVFNSDMSEMVPPCAMILDEHSFEKILHNNSIYFFGSGSKKWEHIIQSKNALFISGLDVTKSIAQLSYTKFLQKDFTTLAYSEPYYIKEFFSP